MNKWTPAGPKPMLSKLEVAEIAKKFMADTVSENAGKRVRQYSYELELESVRPAPFKIGYWVGVFHVKTVEGHVVDGPTVVLVEDASKQAMFLE